MFFIANRSPYSNHRGRYHRVRHGAGRFTHPYRFQPYVLVDIGGCGARRRMSHDCAKLEKDPATDSELKRLQPAAAATSEPSEITKNKERKGDRSSEINNSLVSKSLEASDTSFTSGDQLGDAGKTIVERTPVHRTETEEVATISMDVSGFNSDQLQVRIEEEQIREGTRDNLRAILTVSGERVNALGDKYKIHRRFLLDRGNLTDDIQSIPIQAKFTNDGILSINVPKKKNEKKQKPVSRCIPIGTTTDSQQVWTKSSAAKPSVTDADTNNDDAKKSPEVVTVNENGVIA